MATFVTAGGSQEQRRVSLARPVPIVFTADLRTL